MFKPHSSQHLLRLLAVGLALLVIPAILLMAEARSDEARRSIDSYQAVAVPASPAQFASMKILEERYGVRVSLIGVTAAGGMVDFRFKVLDADKAKVLTQDHSLMPILNVQGSDTRLAIPAGMHSMSFQDGKVYYILFGNPRGEVKPGTPISVAFGDLQVEPIMAQ